jgi:hypothetical protein
VVPSAVFFSCGRLALTKVPMKSGWMDLVVLGAGS